MEEIGHKAFDWESPRWYVMRAYKKEKQAEDVLSGPDGLEFFIPKHYMVRTYHGVKSKRLVPVIPSLVFVHASYRQLIAFKKDYNFLQFVLWKKQTGTECLTVSDRQMEHFIRVASQYEEDTLYHRLEDLDLQKGTRVRILGGRFDGVQGVFMKVKGKRSRRLVVQVDGVIAASVEVTPDLIEVLPEEK